MSLGAGFQAGAVTGAAPGAVGRPVPRTRGRIRPVRAAQPTPQARLSQPGYARQAQPPQGGPGYGYPQPAAVPGQPGPGHPQPAAVPSQPGAGPQAPTPQRPAHPTHQPGPPPPTFSPIPAGGTHGRTGQRGETVVEARGLYRVYGTGDAQVTALDGVSLAVQRGQFVAIMGASGSGKSTLLHCLAGLDAPTQGQVLIAGKDLTAMKDQELTTLRRDHLGFVFQSFNLLPTLNAQENILLPLRLAHRKPEQDWFDAVVSVLGIQNRLDHRPTELSGGQQQRVAVARALIGRPAVVFADEPTGALDTASSAALLEVLARACQTLGQTVVMVTHDPDAAATTSRIIRLADGRITHDQPVDAPSGTHAASAPAPGAQAPRAGAPSGTSQGSRHAAGSL